MSIQSEIDRINTAKSNIATAIEAKGVDVPEEASIDEMATYILNIPEGSSEIEWNDVLNKPVDEVKTTYGSVVAEGNTLSWDGNTEGMTAVTGYYFGYALVLNKLTDFQFESGNIVGTIFFAAQGQELSDSLIASNPVSGEETKKSIMFQGAETQLVMGFMIYEEELEDFNILLESQFGFTLPQEGFYIICSIEGMACENISLTFNNYTFTGSGLYYRTEPIALKKDLEGIVPEVSTDDNGKFLRVVDGAWAVSSVPNAEEASF